MVWHKFGLDLSFGSDFVTCLFGLISIIELYILQFGTVYFCLQQYELVILDYVTCLYTLLWVSMLIFYSQGQYTIICCGIELLQDLCPVNDGSEWPWTCSIGADVSSYYYRLGSTVLLQSGTVYYVTVSAF